MEKLVIIPTYNERENIAAIIAAVFELQAGYHILIIDDGSPDGTAAIVEDLMKQHEGQLFIEKRTGKLGLGTAYIHGFKWALAKGYQYIFEMDADFSHSPQDLERLYAACNIIGADVAVGSRYVKGGRTENWPLDRHIYSKGGAFYTKLITWLPVNDPTAGFVCYKRKVLETINLDEIRFVGYAFQIEMKYRAFSKNFTIVEVPIIFTDRTKGQSKMSGAIFQEAVFGVIALRLKKLVNTL
mgnify:CR=1 FL=1